MNNKKEFKALMSIIGAVCLVAVLSYYIFSGIIWLICNVLWWMLTQPIAGMITIVVVGMVLFWLWRDDEGNF